MQIPTEAFVRPDLQLEFVSLVTEQRHRDVLADLELSLGMTIPYRVCEMPIFVGAAFRERLESAAVSLVQQCTIPTMIARTEQTLHDRYRVRNESKRPLFSVVDFAVVESPDGSFVPKLIELQGFPSLFGYQFQYADTVRAHYQLLDTSTTFSNLTSNEYVSILRKAIFGSCDPSEVALMEVDPHTQKTRTDFIAMERLIGLQTVNIRSVRRDGNNLVGQLADGSYRLLRRIYNRAIIDELDEMGINLDFEWNEALNVEWAGHPNWYFRMSKFVMPFLSHPSVPTTFFLDRIDTLPSDLSQYVLKPLYSFAGKGVNVTPTESDITAISPSERSQWILQEKVRYASCIATPFGNNKVEIRVMLIWLDDQAAPLPVMSLARTGRGALMGARYNTAPWTGSSGCLFTKD